MGVDGDVDYIFDVQHAGCFGVDLVICGEQGGGNGGGGYGVAFEGRAVQVDAACWGEGEGVDSQAEFGGEEEEAARFWFWGIHCEFLFGVGGWMFLLFPQPGCC